jgi:site-specific DNA-methyltransferase (adenine-specific)
MKPEYQDDAVTLWHGDCLDVLRTLPDNSVDSVVTDPPYGLEFMGKDWDGADGFRRSLNPNDAGRDNAFGRTSKTSPEYRTTSKASAGMMPTGYTDGANRLERPSHLGGLNPKCRNCDHWQRGGNPCTCDAPDFPNERLPRLHDFQVWCEAWSVECLRVLKPGGYMLAFGGTRTSHRLACAIEDAGFEIRDSIAWLYGSGFPKSLDVSKAIDKAAGAEREVTGSRPTAAGRTGYLSAADQTTSGYRPPGREFVPINEVAVTAPATPDAATWQGWGTALKPAHEPIVVGRKPLIGTVAANVLAHGTGALNIDGCRVGAEERTNRGMSSLGVMHDDDWKPGDVSSTVTGRWPANVVLDGSQADALDAQSGTSQSRIGKPRGAANGDGWGMTATGAEYDDQGGPSRFFPTFRYEAKAPTTERPTYQRDGEVTSWGGIRTRCTICGRQEINVSGACACPEPDFQPDPAMTGKVAHPTVKPLDLMRWLVRLVTPRGGTVLDPFSGSGTTAEACILEGFQCIAIEREADYLPLIVQRISKPLQVGLDFDFGAAS